MALVLSSQVPSAGVSVIRDGLERLSSSGSCESAALAAVRERAPQSLTLTAPHGVYRLAPARDGGTAKCLDGASRWAWRYLVKEGATVHAAADAISGHDGVTRFGGFHFGPFARATAEGIRAAESLLAVRRSDYELRLLGVPETYLVALWLKAMSDGVEDVLVPLAPLGVPTMVAGQPYPQAAFCALLTAALRELTTVA